MTVPRNSVLFTDRSGWFRINPLNFTKTNPLDPDWQFFNNIREAQDALQFNLLDLLPFIDTSGFYHPIMKIRAGLFVYSPTVILLKDLKDTYVYPSDGWTWYDSASDAALAGVDIPEINMDLL